MLSALGVDWALLLARLSGFAPDFGEITNTLDWTPAMSRSISAVAPNAKFRVGAF
jgi:hypothetical protein